MFERSEKIAKALYVLTAIVLVLGAAALCLAALPLIGAVFAFAVLIVLLGWVLNLTLPLFLAAGFAGGALATLASRLNRKAGDRVRSDA